LQKYSGPLYTLEGNGLISSFMRQIY
jgi:hypothetical protein